MLRFFNNINNRTLDTLIQNVDLPYLNQLATFGYIQLSTNVISKVLLGLALHKDENDGLSFNRTAACVALALYAGLVTGAEFARNTNELMGYRYN